MSNTVGVRIIERTCQDIVEERFDAKVVLGAASTYQLISNSSTRCLEIANASVANGAGLIQGDCADAAVRFVIPQSGACSPVTACAYENGGCGDPSHKTCTDTAPGQRTCGDINECNFNNGGCGDPAHFWCSNWDGGYSCGPRNECAENPWICGNPGYNRCTDTYWSYSCADIDECAEHPGICGPERTQRCFNQANGYRCQYLGQVQSQSFGGAGGTWFDFDVDYGRIRGFDIYYSEDYNTNGGINGITVYYTDDAHYLSPNWWTSVHFGGYANHNANGNQAKQLWLDWDDYVTGFYGYSREYLYTLGFTTAKHPGGFPVNGFAVGTPFGTYFQSIWNNSPYPFWASGLYGKAGSKIDQLGLNFR